MADPVVRFYYGLGSRYSYLASTQIDALERETGCRVEWCPFDSRALMRERGRDPFDGPPLSGQYEWPYRELDARRWADLYGVDYVEPRGRFEIDSRLLALAAVAGKRLGRVREVSHELFAAVFRDPTVTRIDREECGRRAVRCGIPEVQFAEELSSDATARDLAAAMEEARERGVFGVPTFVVGDELFWGNDRLVLLRHHLSKETKAR